MAIKIQHVFVSSHSRSPLQAVQIKSTIIVAIVVVIPYVCTSVKSIVFLLSCLQSRAEQTQKSFIIKLYRAVIGPTLTGWKRPRYRFKKNVSWEKNCMKPIFTMLRASELFIVLGNLEKQMCNVRNLEPKWWTSEETAGLDTTACMIVLQAEWTS